jgi:NADPH:quinone reductase-like Zn-dependent oxidoreductase
VKAIVRDAYGDAGVLRLDDIDKPAFGAKDVLVAVRAAGVDRGAWHAMTGLPLVARLGFGLRAPRNRVLGMDLAGVVEAVGAQVTGFRVGNEVFGTGTATWAEFARARADKLIHKPAHLTFEQAAALPTSGATARRMLGETGGRVLVIGAGGGVGSFAVQLAKARGDEVTGVCSTAKTGLVKRLGADHVIDYTQQDYTQSGQNYDLVFQLAGSRSPSECRRALAPKGTLVLISGDSDGRWIGPVDRIIRALVLSPFVSQKMASFTVKPNKEDLLFLKRLIEAGKLTPVIDRTYPLGEVPEAIRYLEEGHARGKVVISV